MSIYKDRVKEIIDRVATEYGLENWDYKMEENNETITTYFGVLVPLTVTGVIENEKTSLHVYVKLPTVDERIRYFSGYLWYTEVYFYSAFVPVCRSFSNVNIDELIPKCYLANASRTNQFLVLKNMKYEGFQNHRDRFLDFEHVVVSLKSLAQFHGLTYIVKKNHDDNDLMKSILRSYTGVYPFKLNEAIINSFRNHSQLFRGTKYERYWDWALENYKIIVVDTTSKVKCLLYGHGDYWKENIIYKYENNVPKKACLLDFQTCNLMSPACDFLYFILNSTNRHLRQLHYHRFVTEYYANFKNTLLDHGVQLDLLYTQEDFISDLNIVAPFCFVRICLAFSLWLGFEHDCVIKSTILWQDDQTRDKELRFFKEILIDAMEDLCNYGYISL